MPEVSVADKPNQTEAPRWSLVQYFADHPRLRCLLYLLVLAGLAAGVMFRELGEHMFVGDEGIYANALDQMIATADWIHINSFPGQPLIDKPPLYFWLTTATNGLFENTQFSYRFWSALLGFGSVLLTAVLGFLLFTPEIGLLGGLFLLTNKDFVFYHGARYVAMDSPLTFFVLLGFVIYCYKSLKRKRRNTIVSPSLALQASSPSLALQASSPSLALQASIYLCSQWRWFLMWTLIGLCVAAGCMLKQMFGLPFLTILALHHLFVDRDLPLSKRLAGPLFAGVVCAVAILPWHLVQWREYGYEFIDAFFVEKLFRRASTGLDPWHLHGPEYYWLDISTSSPVFLLFLPGLVFAGFVVCRSKVHRAPFLLLLLSILFFVGLMTLPKSKLAWYVYPVYPLIAVLLAASLSLCSAWLTERIRNTAKQRVVFHAVHVFLVLTAVSLAIYTITSRIPRHSRWVYPPLQVYRDLEPALQNGKVRLVCYRFARPETAPDYEHEFYDNDIWYARRMPLAVWTDDPQQLDKLLADGKPTYILAGTTENLNDLRHRLDHGDTLQCSSVGPSYRPFPLARNSNLAQNLP